MPRNVEITVHLCSFHMLARLCSNSFKLGFSSTWTKNFQRYKLDIETAEEPEIKLPTFIGSWRKQRNSIKISTSASLTMLKPLTVWITTKFLKTWVPDNLICLLRNLYVSQEATVRTRLLTGSKLGKERIFVHCHPVYLFICTVHHGKCQAGWSTSWNQDCQEKYQQLQICRWFHPNSRKQRACWRWKKRVKKLFWNSTFKKLRLWHLVSLLHGK